MKVPEFVNPGERHIRVVVVHHRGALEIPGRQDLDLEIQGAPAQSTLRVVEVAIQRAGVDDRSSRVVRPQLLTHVEPVGVQPNVDAVVVGHALQPRGVAVYREALVGVVEVPVVEGVPHRQPTDDGRGKVGRIGLPLLGRVALHERLVERPADQRDRLLLEVARVGRIDLGCLLRNQGTRLVRAEVAAEELRHQTESHRELVGLTVVEGEHPVLIAGERGELTHVVPDARIGRVEQVGAVPVDLDPRLRFRLGVGVPAEMAAPFDHQHPLAELGGRPLGDRQSEETGADDDEVVVCHRPLGYPTTVALPPV